MSIEIEKQNRFIYIASEMTEQFNHHYFRFEENHINVFVGYLVDKSLDTIYSVESVIYLAKELFLIWYSYNWTVDINDMKKCYDNLLVYGLDLLLVLKSEMI